MKPVEAARGGPSGSLRLPSSTFLHLRRALRREAGPLAAIHALHDAGFASGQSLFDAFSEETGGDPSRLDAARFWEELDRFVERAGWGRITQERLHPGLGMVHARDWGESDPGAEESQPSCAFTSGLLAHILGRVAGGPIAVLEVGCRSRGDGKCSFLFGAENAIHQMYGHLLEGASLESALARL